MQYRTSRRTGDRISVIGLGSAYMPDAGMDTAVKALRRAVEGGINYFDLATGKASAFHMYGEALKDMRSRIMYQIHFGADYTTGEYGWSLKLDDVKRSVDWQLKQLQTDYIDYGFIHCQDELSDWETYQRNGVYQYIQDMQAQGVVRHIGLSSHTPHVTQKILDDANVDMLMFSINPAYDFGQGEFANGGAEKRAALYRRCERDGIGITVMKPFSGGLLLDGKRSPFGKPLTVHQCIRYCLDKPGVLTVLPGAQTVEEVNTLLDYENQPDENLDYAAIGAYTPGDALGQCMYCNHCQPCPGGLDIGLINKYYDLAQAGDELAARHYHTLTKQAGNCLHCGHCDKRCPFHVKQSQRMTHIAAYFTKN